MTISKKILVVFLLIFTIFAQNDTKQLAAEGDVIILTYQNFESVVLESEDPWMIDFYAPWCGHCMKMTEEWNKFATQMKGSVRVAKIDASQNHKLHDDYNLNGFPHIVFIPGGKKDKSTYFEHSGTRTAQAFQKWVNSKIIEHKRSQLEKLTDGNKWNQVCLGPHSDFCTVLFLPNITNSSEEEQEFYLKTIQGVCFELIQFAKKFVKMPISWLWAQDGDHKGLQQLLGLEQSFPYIVLINPTGKRFAIMQRPFTEDDFADWLDNIWDIQFKEYQGKLPFVDEIPEPQEPQQL